MSTGAQIATGTVPNRDVDVADVTGEEVGNRIDKTKTPTDPLKNALLSDYAQQQAVIAARQAVSDEKSAMMANLAASDGVQGKMGNEMAAIIGDASAKNVAADLNIRVEGSGKQIAMEVARQEGSRLAEGMQATRQTEVAREHEQEPDPQATPLAEKQGIAIAKGQEQGQDQDQDQGQENKHGTALANSGLQGQEKDQDQPQGVERLLQPQHVLAQRNADRNLAQTILDKMTEGMGLTQPSAEITPLASKVALDTERSQRVKGIKDILAGPAVAQQTEKEETLQSPVLKAILAAGMTEKESPNLQTAGVKDILDNPGRSALETKNILASNVVIQSVGETLEASMAPKSQKELDEEQHIRDQQEVKQKIVVALADMEKLKALHKRGDKDALANMGEVSEDLSVLRGQIKTVA